MADQPVTINYLGEEAPVHYQVRLDQEALAELIRVVDYLQEETEDRASADKGK